MQVLRTTFLLLVLGNLLLFAWGRGYLGQADGGEAERLSAQIEPGKLRVAGIGAPPGAAETPSEACRAFSGIEREAAEKLAEWLGGRDPQLKISRRPFEEVRSWWVHIPPLQNSAQAERKTAELSRLRIKDFHVMRESGPNQHAISLGLFKSEEGAREYLDALQKRGVKSARILARRAPGDKAIVEVQGREDRLAKALADLPVELNAPVPAACPQEGA